MKLGVNLGSVDSCSVQPNFIYTASVPVKRRGEEGKGKERREERSEVEEGKGRG